MGRWMELLRKKPPDPLSYSDREPLRVAEGWPEGLLSAADFLPPEHRREFPWLCRVQKGSPDYDGEEMWLDPLEAGLLLEEFRRFRRLCHRREFIRGLDGVAMYEQWLTNRHSYHPEPDEFEAGLDFVGNCLQRAFDEGLWVWLTT